MTGLQETQLFQMLEKMTQLLIEQNLKLDELNRKLVKTKKDTK